MATRANDRDLYGDGADVRVGATPSAVFHNRISGAGIVYDVYPTFHELAEQCPMEHAGLQTHFTHPDGWNNEPFLPTGDVYTAHGYDHVQDVFRRSSDFSSRLYAQDVDDPARDAGFILGLDEPAHRRLRVLLQPAFTRSEMERWKHSIIQPIVDEHLGRIRPWGRADLYHEVAPNVPIQTISVALGLPAAEQRQFFEWATNMTSGDDPAAAARSLYEYIAPLIAQRRVEPGTDLISILTQARIEGDNTEGVSDRRPLDDAEINGFVGLLIIAGAGTTYKAYGNLMFMLLTHPEVLDAVRADRSLVPQAIEEMLRIESPVGTIKRRAAHNAKLDGVEIPSGCPVVVNIPAANHDVREWGDDADEYDIFRERSDRHLAFGFGIHRCLGIHLARAELNVLCNRTLDLLPNVRLDKDEPAPRMTGLGLRMPTSLPAVWDV